MAKRRVRIQKVKKQNWFGMMLVLVVVFLLLGVIVFQNNRLRAKQEAYAAREKALQEMIDAETARTQEIEEYSKYTKTKAYYEEVAKDKLGLVNEGEVIYKPEN